MAAREITCSQAIAEAIAEEMERDETVFILGEDLVSSRRHLRPVQGPAENVPRPDD